MGWLRRLRATVSGSRVHDTMDEEVRFHLEEGTDAAIRHGQPLEAARRQALKRFGNVGLAKARTRDADTLQWLDSLLQDLRYAARNLRKAPGLVAVSALSLGLGLGLNMTLYSGLNAVFGRQPTMSDPDRVVGVEPGNWRQFSYPNYQDLRDSGIFAETMAFRAGVLNRDAGVDLERIEVLVVTANFFSGLGVQPFIGRTFVAGEAAPERSPRVVVLSHYYWRARFGADPNVLGQTMTLAGEPFVIIGVLREEHQAVTGFATPTAYVPLSTLTLSTLADRGSPSLNVIARLRPEGTREQAQAAVTALGERLERRFPQQNEGLSRPASIFPVASIPFRGSPGFVFIPSLLAGLFGLVLLVGAVNVAGLLLARAASRRHELAVRAALGAGRRRVMQLLFVESFLLTLLGAAAGLLLNVVFNRLPLPGGAAGLQELVAPDLALAGPALVLIVVTTLICGLVPAIRANRLTVVSGLRQAEAGHTGRDRLRHALIVGQVAMSLTVLVVASLCLRSQMRLYTVKVGFDLDHGVVARFNLDSTRASAPARVTLAKRAIEAVEQSPGIRSAAVTSFVPLGGDAVVASFHPAGRSDIPGTRPLTLSVGPRYFETLAIPLLRGREFLATDTAGAPVVAIANQTFADTYFPGGSALGQPVDIGGEQEAEIVGIVGDSRMDTIGEAPKSVVYYAYAQRPGRLTVLTRTDRDPGWLVPTVQRALVDIDPTVGVEVGTLRDAASLELTMRRAATTMVGAVGAVGLLLAVIGLYGVVAYLVASNTMEIGIRMALGASPRRLHWTVLRHAVALVAGGIVVGTLAAILVTPALATFLAGLSPFDPLAFGGAAALLTLVALLASYLPARRVMRVDPVIALRR